MSADPRTSRSLELLLLVDFCESRVRRAEFEPMDEDLGLALALYSSMVEWNMDGFSVGIEVVGAW